MTIPVYVVTGFLYAGKTTFLNAMLNRYDRSKIKTLLLQFESGEEAFQGTNDYCICKCFSKKELEGQPDQMIRAIYRCVKEQAPDEVWIEWNGVTPFSLLQDFFQSTLLRSLRIQKVIHIADVSGLEDILGRTGTSLPEQIANSDAVILRISQKNSGTVTYQRMRPARRRYIYAGCTGDKSSSYFIHLLCFWWESGSCCGTYCYGRHCSGGDRT